MQNWLICVNVTICGGLRTHLKLENSTTHFDAVQYLIIMTYHTRKLKNSVHVIPKIYDLDREHKNKLYAYAHPSENYYRVSEEENISRNSVRNF